jgi:hypothetical protein
MNNTDIIWIFQQPNLYFFPHYKDIVFSPFGVKERSLPYWIYRAMHILHIPGYQFFWGEWKKHLAEAKKVIIFDYGYQRGMEQYIHKVNPDCEVYLFMWNMIDAVHKNHTIYSEKENIYSTDKGDCEKYQLKYNHIFYPKEYAQAYNKEYSKKLLFLGADKNRGKQMVELKHLLQKSGLQCDIRVLSKSKDAAYLKEISEVLITAPMSYEQYLNEVKQNGILLDIVQAGQRALTMRVMESIFLSRKLITNNADVVNYDFYHPNNIFVLPHEWDDRMVEQVKEFSEKPFVPYDEDILKKFDFDNWINSFKS